jgi:predicted secreted hydrolase
MEIEDVPIKPHHRMDGLLGIMLIVAVVLVSTALADDGFQQVTGPCRPAFPEDHGPHPDYRTEWWYYTGNLADGLKRRFGFQLTFFRSALQPPENRDRWPAPASAWRTDQIYLAHAAITDIDEGRHLQAEQMARAALSLAGADQTAGTTTIHLHTWQAVIGPDGHHLTAETDEFSLDLDLTPAKPPVTHGDAGYSRKGQSPEQASCYYSFTSLAAAGNLSVADRQYTVLGSAWMDHEFSTAPLPPGVTGWDWFSLQLSDRTEVMLYMLRQADGTMTPASSGSLVHPSGQVRHLRLEEVSIQPLAYWTSPHSGARYPVKWRVTIASLAVELTVEASLGDQEMRTPRSTGVTYWEGSVQAGGIHGGVVVSGVGYVELTGYAEPFDAPM